MQALSVSDLTVIEGGARIPDAKLQEALEFGRINDLHRVIMKNETELSAYGPILCRSGKVIGRGQPQKIYMLNEEQALLVCMFARTPKAPAARRMIVDVFMAWHRGEVLAQPSPDNAITIGKDEYIHLLRAENALLSKPAHVPRKPYTPLTDGERAEILRLTKDGMGVNAIARLVGRSTATVSLLRAGFRIIDGGAA